MPRAAATRYTSGPSRSGRFGSLSRMYEGTVACEAKNLLNLIALAKALRIGTQAAALGFTRCYLQLGVGELRLHQVKQGRDAPSLGNFRSPWVL